MTYPLAPCPTMQPGPRRTDEVAVAPSPHHASPVKTDATHVILPVHDTEALVIVQDERVVCVVECHRHHSAISVARLLCRLLLSDAHLYACPLAHSGTVSGGDPLPRIPGDWREVFRATSWAEATGTVIDIR